MTYSLWLRPDPNAAEILRAIIEQLAVKYDGPVFQPHITLLGRIDCTQKEVIHLTQSLASNAQPFVVKCQSLETQQHYFRCLYLRTAINRSLIKLHTQAKQLFGMTSIDDYMPHLSLLYGDFSAASKCSMLADPLLTNLPGSLYITHIDVYATTEDTELWQRVCFQSLKTQP